MSLYRNIHNKRRQSLPALAKKCANRAKGTPTAKAFKAAAKTAKKPKRKTRRA